MQKWEYIFLDRHWTGSKWIVKEINGENMANKKLPFFSFCEALGDEGWELVSIWTIQFIFKRPKP